MMSFQDSLPVESLFFIKIKGIWGYMKSEHFAFWFLCGYLFFEYFRPQAIYPAINVLPWAQIFILLSIVFAVLDPSVKWAGNPVNKWLNMFAVWVMVSSLVAYDPDVSREHYIDFYSWFVVYYLIINITNSRNRYYVLTLVFLACAGKIALGTSLNWASRGFAFAKWGLIGPPGYFQNSGELSVLMLTVLPVAFYLLVYSKERRINKIEKIILYILVITPIMTIIGASSRGSQLALLVLFIYVFRGNIFKLKTLFYLSILALIIWHYFPDEQVERLASMGEDRTSVQRLLYWKHGLEMIQEYPLTGVGYFNFPVYYADHFPGDILFFNAQLPHNIFIQVGTDAGIPALIVFLSILVSPFMYYRSVNKQKRLHPLVGGVIKGFLGGIVGFVIAGQFVTITYYPFLWIGLAFVVSGLNIEYRINKMATSQ